MASTTKAVTKEGGPLSFMTRLSQYVYLYRPSTTSTNSPSPFNSNGQRPPPRLILLLSWMGAHDPHIAKYITPYLTLYPSTPILLIKSEMKHIFRPQTALPEMEVAVPVLREVFGAEMLQSGSSSFGSIHEDSSTTALTSPPPNNNIANRGEDQDPTLLIHLFSNGGSSQLLSLHHFLLPLSLRLPPHLTIFDSAPGQLAYLPSYTALSHVLLPRPSSLPFPLWLFSPSTLRRLVISPLIHLWVSLLCTLNFFSRFPGLKRLQSPLVRLAKEQNDTSPNKGRAEREKGRMYIYSEGDELVRWRDVEGHMEEARREGLKVRGVKVRGTGHVGHARGGENEGRYWGLVKGFWEGEGWM
ncbi:hypothetical protein B0T20DRAFT_414532 [Sordaria brevicollis]|uniref:Indole-diterpene biosynthesis protein PaxU n=1 Tax=Sordaria brevicollis TaxID=83679 RepID=A0AAE0UAF2_SORBR|nr:hypothetical protein B0T20DRAFT_414532 [Sordaria brevicollis]